MGASIHSVPEHDLREHVQASPDCWCEPRIKWYGDNQLIVHQALRVQPPPAESQAEWHTRVLSHIQKLTGAE